MVNKYHNRTESHILTVLLQYQNQAQTSNRGGERLHGSMLRGRGVPSRESSATDGTPSRHVEGTSAARGPMIPNHSQRAEMEMPRYVVFSSQF